MTPLGVTVPVDAPPGGRAAALRELVAAGYTEFWTAETAGCDAFGPLAYAAGTVEDIQLGTAIASVYARGPALLAMSAATLAELAPGRFALGIGASSPLFAEGWNATPYDRPLARVRDTVRFLRRAFAGERVDASYETFGIRGFRLERPPEHPPPILLGALRPGMLRLAATEADGAVLNWLSARDVSTVVRHLETAQRLERAAGSPRPEVAARIFVCPSTDAPVVRQAARRLVATYASVPSYAKFHEWLGRGPALAETWRRWSAGDRRGAADAVPDEVVDALIVHGSARDCAAHLRRYVEAGVTRPIVKLLELGPGRDLHADALAVARAVRDDHGGSG